MGTVKNATYKVHNGTDFDEIHFKTKAAQVFCEDGKTVEAQLAELVNGFANSKGTTGYTKLPNGYILQWGNMSFRATSGRYDTGVRSFPLAFTSQCLFIGVQIHPTDIASWTDGGGNAYADSVTTFRAVMPTVSGKDYMMRWFSIGY